MGKWVHKFNCCDCGVYTERFLSNTATKCCVECGITRAQLAAVQMFNKSGAAWDTFMASRGAQGRPKRNPRKG